MSLLTFITSPNPLLRRPNLPLFLSSRQAPPKPRQISARIIPLPTGLDMEVIDLPPYRTPLHPTYHRSEKPPLLFIHGSLHAAWAFCLFQPFFAQLGYQTFSISLRGAGLSRIEAAEMASTVEQHILDLTALLDKLQLSQPPVLVAHSLGGFIVQKWVQLKSFCPSKMILLASSTPSANAGLPWRMLAKYGVGRAWRISIGFIRNSCAEDVQRCREMFFSEKNVPGFLEEFEGDEKLKEYMKLLKTARRIVDGKSLREPIKANEATENLYGKVLVIGAERDVIVDDVAVEETAHFWGTTPYVVHNAPHDLMLASQWKEVAQYIYDWLETKS